MHYIRPVLTRPYLLKLLVVGLMGLSLTAVGCDNEDDPADDPEEQVAYLQGYHAVHNTGAVDIRVDDERLATLDYKQDFDYEEVPIGMRSFAIRRPGAEADSLSVSRDIEAQGTYSLFVLGAVGDTVDNPVEIKIVRDLYDAPAAGQTLVRVLHAVTDGPVITFGAEADNGDADFEFADLSYRTVSGFRTLQPGTYDMNVFDASQLEGLPLYTESVTLQSGQAYTLSVVGSSETDDYDIDIIEHEEDLED